MIALLMPGGPSMPDIKWDEDKVQRMICSPYYCITVHPMFCEEHPYITPEELWIDSNVNLLKNMGSKAYLQMLLEVLKGGVVMADGEVNKP
jgi:hypothetical protein